MQKKTESAKFHKFCDHNFDHFQPSKCFLRDAIESLPHAFYIIDTRTYAIQIANSATAIFGELAEGATCYSLTHNRTTPCDGHEHKCPLQQIKETKKPVTVEHVHYDKNNNPRHYEIRAYPICDKNKVVQMIEYSLDITDRKKAEQALKNAYAELDDRVKERTKELQEANQALRQEIIKHKRTEKQLNYHQQMLRSTVSDISLGEERQRRAIAIDLHDGIGQTLALMQMRLSEVSKLVNDPAAGDKLKIIYKSLEQIIQETRSLTFEISPPLLYEIGLEAAIDWLLERFQEQHNIKTYFHDDGHNKDLHEDIRIILYRIVRELLINVTKHAQAKSVSVSMARNKNYLHIRIEDDGIGFDVDTVNRHAKNRQSYGLFSISERLKVLGGRIVLKSKPGKGTKVDIIAPLKIKQKTASSRSSDLEKMNESKNSAR